MTLVPGAQNRAFVQQKAQAGLKGMKRLSEGKSRVSVGQGSVTLREVFEGM